MIKNRLNQTVKPLPTPLQPSPQRPPQRPQTPQKRKTHPNPIQNMPQPTKTPWRGNMDDGREEGRRRKGRREKGKGRRRGLTYIIYTRYIVIAGKRCKITSRDHTTQDHVTHDHITHHKLLKSLHIQVGRSHGHTVTRSHDTQTRDHTTHGHTVTRLHYHTMTRSRATG